MTNRILEIKARLFDIQYHTCNGCVSIPPKPGDHYCTLCDEYHLLLCELDKLTSVNISDE